MNIDTQIMTPDGKIVDVSRIKRLHPTLKKCRCGLIDTKHVVINHILGALRVRRADQVEEFWTKHGEVPLNEGEET